MRLEFVDSEVVRVACTDWTGVRAIPGYGEHRVAGLSRRQDKLGIGLIAAIDAHPLEFAWIAACRDIGVAIVVDHHHRAIVISDDQRLVARIVELKIHADHVPRAFLADHHLRHVGLKRACVKARLPASSGAAAPSAESPAGLTRLRDALNVLHPLLRALHSVLHLLRSVLARLCHLLHRVLTLLRSILPLLRGVPHLLPDTLLRLGLCRLILWVIRVLVLIALGGSLILVRLA